MKNAFIPKLIKWFHITIIVVGLSACSTVNSVNKSYSKINRDDGISVKEAKIIAKKSLVDSQFTRKFIVINPKTLKNPDTYPHPNHYFLKSKSKLLGSDGSSYLVVIDKRTGEVIYSRKNYPTYIKGYRWIMNLPEGYQDLVKS